MLPPSSLIPRFRVVSSVAEHSADNGEVGGSMPPRRMLVEIKRFALVARRQSRRLLSGKVQVRVLPGAIRGEITIRVTSALNKGGCHPYYVLQVAGPGGPAWLIPPRPRFDSATCYFSRNGHVA